MNTHWCNVDLDWFENGCGRYLPSSLQADWGPVHHGRLGIIKEGGGQTVAIGNYVNQRLLAPFHDWLMAVLRRIPMDGTHDQTAPLRSRRLFIVLT